MSTLIMPYVPPERLINTTSPLSGGGNLTADRTLTSSAGSFGTAYQTAAAAGPDTTTGTALVTEVTLSMGAGTVAGDYLFLFQCELKVSAVTAGARFEGELDAAAVFDTVRGFAIAAQLDTANYAIVKTLSAGAHTVLLRFARLGGVGTETITIQNSRIVVWRVV